MNLSKEQLAVFLLHLDTLFVKRQAALVDCTVNGEPSYALCNVQHNADESVDLVPIMVVPTKGLDLRDPFGTPSVPFDKDMPVH